MVPLVACCPPWPLKDLRAEPTLCFWPCLLLLFVTSSISKRPGSWKTRNCTVRTLLPDGFRILCDSSPVHELAFIGYSCICLGDELSSSCLLALLYPRIAHKLWSYGATASSDAHSFRKVWQEACGGEANQYAITKGRQISKCSRQARAE